MSHNPMLDAIRAHLDYWDKATKGWPGANPATVEALRAELVKGDAAHIDGRWRCSHCKSHNVQISLPTWYYESQGNDLTFVETDGDADISWWYCEDCDEADNGQPEDVNDD